jgi:polyisoprenoid-binding protein YceI
MNVVRGLSAGRSMLTLILATMLIPSEGAQAVSGTLIDPSRTSVEFIVDGVGWPRTKGRFTAFSGKIAVDLKRPEASSVYFRVAAKSVDVGSPSFDDYLRDAFFDVADHPDITFVSTSVEKVDDRRARVTGDLTLRGVTRPFTVNVEVGRAANQRRLDFHATGVVHRLEFGMNAGFPAISNDVDLIISTGAEPEAE